ncbi:hypothetical protein KXZ74_25860, partial [Escherichia coli]|nr:hypothetical protein [Escherichia coli]
DFTATNVVSVVSRELFTAGHFLVFVEEFFHLFQQGRQFSGQVCRFIDFTATNVVSVVSRELFTAGHFLVFVEEFFHLF